MRYAFDELGQPQVISLIQPGNERSIRVAERLGESLEGRTEVNGQEVLVFGIRREQWKQQQRNSSSNSNCRSADHCSGYPGGFIGPSSLTRPQRLGSASRSVIFHLLAIDFDGVQHQPYAVAVIDVAVPMHDGERLDRFAVELPPAVDRQPLGPLEDPRREDDIFFDADW